MLTAQDEQALKSGGAPAFLTLWGLPSLRDLPDLDRLEDAGLLGTAPLPGSLLGALGLTGDDEDEDEDDDRRPGRSES